ncbi:MULTISPECIES: hypothetical protein [Fusobacterium]|jgi:polyhydroxyalkanoate synthesis regulator phasin|uniref:SpoVT-AbrB domain-containing protein n=1 Tax=Fusobacterium varium ATCC 27725 TaxID=469618 RepID=A0ABN5JJE0_FUSVA|nr:MULTISPECIES: hypothetical protein [Fusobacterium]AVQ31745.1 hypothetical protein C4N18_11165 [Fusobacterium varium ATCC 27725]EES63090.1 hypothetical protein FVAG_00779 [Fusobacterium varium ATCC 27725]MCB8563895.1 hypothetical protein [Fusobacterium ulcerans]MCB8648264.1 hypothetical protein [Fusobacterium ulcerans]MEE0137171.1 hypothetical protein [Fusobacterium ulcerans]
MDIYSKYNISIPKRKITELDVDDQIKVLTFRTGKIVPRVLKDLDEYLKKFGGRKVSLLYKGKKDKRENYKMREYVSEYGEYFDEIEGNIIEVLEDILEQIIDDMNKYDKNLDRKNDFFDTLDSFIGGKFIFIIGIISLGEFLIKKYGYIKNGRYLGEVLKAKADLKNKITDVFKKMNQGYYTKEEANELFKEMIEKKVYEQTKIDAELYEEIKIEDDLSRICEDDSIDMLIFDMVDKVRLKATKQERFPEMKVIK